VDDRTCSGGRNVRLCSLHPTVMSERDAAWDNESLRADQKVDAAVTPSPDA
jgi:hypothetical protein